MEDKIFIAIIAASSALLGSLIPTVLNYLNSREQRNFETKKDLQKKQKEVYLELMLSLQDMINYQTDNSKFFNLQNSVIKASLYADDKTAQTFYDYYDSLVKSNQNMQPLTQKENQRYQSDILNSIRKSMGLESIEEFKIVGFHPTT